MKIFYTPLPLLADIALPEKDVYVIAATIALAIIDITKMIVVYRSKKLESQLLESSKK